MLYRERQRMEHDRDVWLAWYGERFARTERLGLPNDYLIEKHEGRGKPQTLAQMKAALNMISASVNGRKKAS